MVHRRQFMQGLAASAGVFFGGSAFANLEDLEKYSVRIDWNKVRDRNQNRSTVAALDGMVCTSQPLASMAGIDILKSGGNAIDAAIAANAVLGVVEPMNCGIGGDLFAICWIEKEQKLFGLNASGRSPYNWNLRDALDMGFEYLPAYSPLAWNVPGCVSGWEALNTKFGKKGFQEILAPAIHYATEGFPLSPIIAGGWDFTAAEHPTLAETFMPMGHAPGFGEVFKIPDFAKTLQLIAKEGPGVFYHGEIADRIVKFSEANGGKFTKKDFEDHEANWVDPVSTNYRGYDVWEIPPNGQGIAVLQILNMLETFDIGSMAPNSPEQLHLFLEAKKLAFEDRAVYYADMDFAPVPLDQLISKEYGKERAKKINPNQASRKVVAGNLPRGGDTIYLTAADSEGNMISFIQSLYHGWGSHIVPDHLGFPIQNRGLMFALDPNHFNKLEPHKRPFHTIIPAFVTKEGQPIFSFGVMGGDFQPQGHSQVLMNLIDFGMSPQQAGEQPRVEHNGSSTPMGKKMVDGGTIKFELGFPDSTKLALAEKGHRIQPGAGMFGGYQGIWREEDPRRYFGGTDPRKDGCAIGW
ncbi:MAG: gamma-glutamyltransferase [Candidatus Omnitrophica bacterium]|nr:gamma-glutamyltransferase [Candidatus Omnitrophota bacterium]